MDGPIVVPLDGSPLAEHALGLAISLARRERLAVHLVRVHLRLPEGEYPAFNEVDEQIRGTERAYLTKMARVVAERTGGAVYTALLEEPIAGSIEAYARGHRAALIVATTHGRGGLSRMWLGSVVDQLVRIEGIPVITMRPDEGPPDIARTQGFRHVLVALDGSVHAETVLPPAIAIGGLRDVRYTLVQVVRATSAVTAIPGPWAPTLVVPVAELVEQMAHRAEAYLRAIAERLRGWGVEDVRTMVAVDDRPAAALLRCISSYKADLVAMSTHGRGTSRLVVGSVADKVLRAAGRPVLLVRPLAEVKTRKGAGKRGARSKRETGSPGGGQGRRDIVGESAVYAMSAGGTPGGHAEVRTMAAWGQGDRGAAGAEDSGGSELLMYHGQLVGGTTAGPSGEPTIDIHGGAPSRRAQPDEGRDDR
jgi:nucleotide-binding universal stress UspA family protein